MNAPQQNKLTGSVQEYVSYDIK